MVYPSQCAWPQLVKLWIYFTTLMFALHLSHQPLEYYAYSNYPNINEHQPFNTYRSKVYILLVYQRSYQQSLGRFLTFTIFNLQ